MAWACAGVGTFVGGCIYAERIMMGVCGERLMAVTVQNLNEITIPCRVIAIWLIGLDRCLPSWIFEAGVRGPLHTLRHPVFHAHTKFREDTLIGARDMPPKRNSKKTPPGGGILPVSRLTPASLGELCMCHCAKFQKDWTVGG